MSAFRNIGIAALAGAAILALTAGAVAAVSAPPRAEAETNVHAVHGCHLGCVKTGAGTAHRHFGRACLKAQCWRSPSPPPAGR